ncbi:restriction endonuclease subunit S [Skermanella mucosa]|uniref:restriction endonuclease subunit S n=1 Tax=Skermanella mucosa TaxID=1789672 RepID=UPI00225DF81C|nr:restriction endonuclease subunit S [Skermanella mucosa]
MADIVGGSTPSKDEASYWEDGTIAWATPSDVTKLPIGVTKINRTASSINDKAIKGLSLRLLPPGSVLMTSRATIGYPVINLVPMTTNQGFANFLPSRHYDPTFLTQWIIYNRLNLERLAGGSTFLEISKKSLKSFPIALPPLHAQRRIAEILTSVDEAIQATQAVIEQTRKVKQGVLKRLLTRGIGHTRFKLTEVGEIPETWELKPLGELCTLTNGNGFRPTEWTSHGLPIIRIQNLNGSREFNYFAGTPKDKWIVDPGDLLFSWAGVRGVSFGPHLWDGPRGVLNQHIFKVHSCSEVDKFWLFFAMTLVTTRIESKAHGFKASLLHVHKSEITNQLIAVPPKPEQEKIVHRLNALSEAEQASREELASLKETKSALLSDLLSGQKRVFIDNLAAAE